MDITVIIVMQIERKVVEMIRKLKDEIALEGERKNKKKYKYF